MCTKCNHASCDGRVRYCINPYIEDVHGEEVWGHYCSYELEQMVGDI